MNPYNSLQRFIISMCRRRKKCQERSILLQSSYHFWISKGTSKVAFCGPRKKKRARRAMNRRTRVHVNLPFMPAGCCLRERAEKGPRRTIRSGKAAPLDSRSRPVPTRIPGHRDPPPAIAGKQQRWIWIADHQSPILWVQSEDTGSVSAAPA